ncbi:VWA domain-containing protein [Alginatibacterium sediminis]|uniref:VWA domain-containing protein n=1 Tax=Alginatibacterium sediminis TaxID=2164068 RepID=A0A420EDI7_9ALTE|nr:VWA domain-containing protein [Alginatibacterium sediminis]RKF18730.1 VWA domain-containing protein [Alginatibacterium sediminis]
MQISNFKVSLLARSVALLVTVSVLGACGGSKDRTVNHDQKKSQPVEHEMMVQPMHPMLAVEQHAAVAVQSKQARMSQMKSLAAVQYPNHDIYYHEAINTENYQKLQDASVVSVLQQPVSTFSADVDTASYSNMRRFINSGALPPKDAVRVEELINYFSYDYKNPSNSTLSLENPITLSTLLSASPWNANNQLIRIGVSAYQPDVQQRSAANIVFLVDVSGSMQSNEKLPLLKQSMLLMLNNLNEDDRVAIVTYASGTSVALPSTKVSNKADIEYAIQSLSAGGSTNGSAGIELAYRQAQLGFIENGINHVYLMSDGDLNVGMTDIDHLKHRISQKRKAGVQFSTIGFGEGNYNDHLMEQLADTGNGVAGYIDTLHEAQKLLVDQLGSTLFTVAHDVKFQVEFNPRMVSEYRLLGYENRQLERADFNNDKKDAGDMGAGHSVTAIYEITPAANQGLIDPLVFQVQASNKMAKPSSNEALAEVRVRYKQSQSSVSQKYTQRVLPTQYIEFDNITQDDRFAIAVAAFGQKLRGNSVVDDLSFAQIIDWASSSKGSDQFGYRSEFVKLARLSHSMTAALSSEAITAPVPQYDITPQPTPLTLQERNQAHRYELSQR